MTAKDGHRGGAGQGRESGAAARRLKRERFTVETMIGMYCRGNHGVAGSLCPDCLELRDYARKKVENCPLLADKPACDKCAVHCYSPAMRERIRQVMRYSGPRMLLSHPVLTFFHILDGRRRDGR